MTFTTKQPVKGRIGFWQRAARARRGAVSIIFAAAAIPLVAIVGLAIDFGIWNEVNASLQLAADSAALNAAKVAGQGEIDPDPNYLYLGYVAGQLWFQAASGFANNANVQSNTTVTGTTTITATVSYTGQVPSIFGGMLYKIASYPINGTSTAIVQAATYLDVEIMLDNSSSMQIGASYTDIENLMYWTACDKNGAYYNVLSNGTLGTSPVGSPYGNYMNTYNGQTYVPTAGGPSYPFLMAAPYPQYGLGQPFPTPGNTFPGYLQTGVYAGPLSCPNLPQNTLYTGPSGPVKQYPMNGEPCAFACHTDGSGNGNDFYGTARNHLFGTYPVTLRFDVVKNATNAVIQQMQADDLAFRNLNVGVFTFNDQLTQVYPAAGSACSDGAPVGEACDAWTTALADVGGPPTYNGGPDTGIQPEILTGLAAHADTDFVTTMTKLGTILTKSGTGLTAGSPKKVLFLITDGVNDLPGNGQNTVTGFDYSQCTNFKNMGYTIYVIYTPYYPLMDFSYLALAASIVQPPSGSSTSTVSSNLQQCSSDPVNDYIAATNQSQLTNALTSFLKAALSTPVRFQS
jgi:Flp pilus assembly protein TadG